MNIKISLGKLLVKKDDRVGDSRVVKLADEEFKARVKTYGIHEREAALRSEHVSLKGD